VKAKANKDRTDYDRPPPPRGVLFVVATQTVEVGADFSFDALVTELAPLDALRQRLGRVDRLGFRGQSRVVIIRNKEADKDDPVYGKAPAAVWKVLKEWEKAAKPRKGEKEFVIDFGIQATDDRLPKDPEERAEFLAPLCAPFSLAPVMLPAHVDDWVQTSIAPEPDPDPALFLHGPEAGPADVSVIWRADVTQDALNRELGRKDARTLRRLIAPVPPTSMEALSLPIWHVRQWLRNRTVEKTAVANFTDLEGEREPESELARHHDDRTSDPFLIWKGPDREDGTVASDQPDDIRPGNTIVVPSSYGGCDEFGWSPDHRSDVRDVADDCSWRAKRRPVLRIRPGSPLPLQTLSLWERLPVPFPAEMIQRLPALLLTDEETGESDWNQVAQEFRGLPDQFAWLRTARRVSYPDGLGAVFVGRRGVPYPGDPNSDITPEEAPADDEGNSFPGGRVLLTHHCREVKRRVEGVAQALALRTAEQEILARAALLHDPGKADPRFQIWLYGSEAEAARNGFELVAKSGLDGRNAAAVEEARERAGWPKGGRHEAGSVLLARSNQDAYRGVQDAGLCEYLIGCHHGRGRPLWPVVEEDGTIDPPGMVNMTLESLLLSADLPARPEAPLTALDAGWAELFWCMVRRYGYWGLAYLETLLVLADHRQSEAEREAQK
jgi:CRISPR-associated endonuclease/helicase Cas3